MEREPRKIHGCNTMEKAQLSCIEDLVDRKKAFCGNFVHSTGTSAVKLYQELQMGVFDGPSFEAC